MSRRQPNSLHVVLALRKRKEEAEERKLIAVNQQIQQLIAREKRVGQELARLALTRSNELTQLSDGLHHQEREGKFRQLQQARAEVIADRNRLQGIQANQMALYLAARRGRQVMSELEEHRGSIYKAELAAREQKLIEDMFLSRRRRTEA